MDAVSDARVETVVVMSSAQVGKTEIELNTVGFHVHHDPAPILVLHPTLEMAEAWSKDRLAPMVRDSPALTGKIADARARDTGNTLLHKTFAGGHITMAGANSPASLASRPIRIVLYDEVDRYPPSAGTEGDPVNLARKRTTTFWNRKLVLVSTPTIAGKSRIEKAFETSDKRYFHVPCPHCGHMQRLMWSRVRFENRNPDTASYQCEADDCGTLWTDAERWAAIRWGRWVATAPFRGIAGFHLSELYSPWRRLSETVADFLEAKDGGAEQLKTWINTALGEVWRDKGEAPEWERLKDRRRPLRKGIVPAGGLALTVGIDTQDDRLEAYVWAWGRKLWSWLVDRQILAGDPAGEQVWKDLDTYLGQGFPTEAGTELRILRGMIDSGGHHTHTVYDWARRQGGWIVAGKGSSNFAAPPLGVPTAVEIRRDGKRSKGKGRLWPYGGHGIKLEFYGWLRQPTPADGEDYPRGWVFLPEWADDEILQQLVAEQLLTNKRGRPEWQKLRDRNEGLDCRVLARAAAHLEGIDRWTDAHWDELEAAIVPVVAAKPAEPTSPAGGGWIPKRNDWLRR